MIRIRVNGHQIIRRWFGDFVMVHFRICRIAFFFRMIHIQRSKNNWHTVPAYVAHRMALPAIIHNRGNRIPANAFSVGNFTDLHQFFRHRYLGFRFFGEGNPYCISYPVCQKGTDADGRFDSPVLPFPGFRYAQVQGIIHSLLFHTGYQKPRGIHHQQRIAGFQGYDNRIEIFLTAHPQKFKG